MFGCSSTININEPVLKQVINDTQLLEDFEYLSSNATEGRKVGTAGSNLAKAYIVDELKKLNIAPYKNKYLHSFKLKHWGSNDSRLAHNIVAVLPAEHKTSEYIVLTAHFDHLGKKRNNIFNGADDNASGTSALLTIARKLSKRSLKHNVLVIFTDGEESRLQGIFSFFNANPEFIQKIKLNINMDMLAGSTSSENLHFMSKNLAKVLSTNDEKQFLMNHNYRNFSIIRGFKRRLSSKNSRVIWLKASDHAAFSREGIPFVYYGVGLHENYHTVNDKFANTNHQLLINSTNAILAQIRFLDEHIE